MSAANIAAGLSEQPRKVPGCARLCAESCPPGTQERRSDPLLHSSVHPFSHATRRSRVRSACLAYS